MINTSLLGKINYIAREEHEMIVSNLTVSISHPNQISFCLPRQVFHLIQANPIQESPPKSTGNPIFISYNQHIF